MKNIILIILLIPSVSFGGWTEEKAARELCYLALLVKDWQQTLDISKHPNLIEKNKILGKNPKTKNIHLYMLSCAVGHAAISYLLPEKYSKIWQVAWTGIQINVTNNNDNNGLIQNIGIEYKYGYSIPF